MVKLEPVKASLKRINAKNSLVVSHPNQFLHFCSVVCSVRDKGNVAVPATVSALHQQVELIT